MGWPSHLLDIPFRLSISCECQTIISILPGQYLLYLVSSFNKVTEIIPIIVIVFEHYTLMSSHGDINSLNDVSCVILKRWMCFGSTLKVYLIHIFHRPHSARASQVSVVVCCYTVQIHWRLTYKTPGLEESIIAPLTLLLHPPLLAFLPSLISRPALWALFCGYKLTFSSSAYVCAYSMWTLCLCVFAYVYMYTSMCLCVCDGVQFPEGFSLRLSPCY